MHYALNSVGRHKLIKESHIILAEEAKVLDKILQICNTLYAHSERISGIDLRVNAASFQHIRVYHAATEDFYPSCSLAHSATLAAADAAADIHLSAWFCEGEVAWTETDACFWSEHLLRKFEKHLLQVGKAHVLVDIETFYLMEEAVCTR